MDGPKENPHMYNKPPSYEVMNPMVNLGSNLSKE